MKPDKSSESNTLTIFYFILMNSTLQNWDIPGGQCLKSLAYQLLVSCGGRRRPADGLRQQHVRTIRLLVWDTLEDFPAFWLYMGRDKDNKTIARCTYVNESAQNDGRASKLRDIFYSTDCYSNNVGLYGNSRWQRGDLGSSCPTLVQLKQQMCRDKM